MFANLEYFSHFSEVFEVDLSAWNAGVCDLKYNNFEIIFFFMQLDATILGRLLSNKNVLIGVIGEKKYLFLRPYLCNFKKLIT